MTTLIAAYNSEGCIGRCDAKCYDAEGPDCVCICHGMNHGKGLVQALQNTTELAQRWMDDWTKEHPDTARFELPPVQLPLF